MATPARTESTDRAISAADVESRAAASPAEPRKRSPLPFILGALLLAGGFWTFKTLTYASAHESTDNAMIEGHVIPVLAKVGADR
jgi:multidrug resistance efflux pump